MTAGIASIAGYGAHAAALAERYESLSFEHVHRGRRRCSEAIKRESALNRARRERSRPLLSITLKCGGTKPPLRRASGQSLGGLIAPFVLRGWSRPSASSHQQA